MPYLVDGHNLIPHAGLRLDATDDELQLVRLLQEYGRRIRKDIEVYFDGAPSGNVRTGKFGRVTAHFVSFRSSADAAIMARLASLQRAARNWTVVSSDSAVMAAAGAAGASIETSAAFARRLLRSSSVAPDAAAERSREAAISDEEVDHWLNEFKRR